ncbi:Gfo/Idh/MocA family protein [Qipengyuania sediminis]|uniref:Gfo/Idh/MocA family protein n=1 Tax=Qipengyuania sediminis TaxID=1532023 RepID=UPI00105AAF8D|nr:Gfo/Idh/MocA family oxidoreductase [Qipengyuania sediminis]
MNPISFGLVGCGRISARHIEALNAHAGAARITDVCDIDPAALEAAAERTGARPHTTLSDLLRNGSCDAVILCTPSGLHPWQAIECAEAGKHVVTEKPMATRWQDGLAMVKACDRAQVKLFVVKQNRKNATLQLLKRAIAEGRFGRIYMVNVNVFWTRPQAYYDSADWRGTWEVDGGAFMNQASHYVDLLDWLIGPVASVHAMTATLERDIQVEDTGVLSIRWRSGALGSMNVTMLTYPQNLEGSITVLGAKGSVRVGGVAVNQIEHWQFADERDYDSQIADASYATESVYGFGHGAYYDNVIRTLRGEAEAETDGREGLKSLELLIATYLSARDGRTISLPLEY